MRKLIHVALALTVTLPGAAFAAHQQPGLWQVTTQSHFAKGGIQIPPEARAQMQARGIKVPDFGAPHTYKHCLTPEKAAEEEHPDLGQNKDCRMVSGGWSGDTFHGEVACNDRMGQTHGTIDATLGGGGTTAVMHMRMQGNSPQLGGDFELEMQSAGKWLGPSCGSESP